ncbi:MAG: DUF4331 domain-containing protein [Verrucomicrobia bacterium]|nr:DUF4331 domain-containing protein [Verrucomicrobiota bacterium]
MKSKLNLCNRALSVLLAGAMAGPAFIAPSALASSHMDAPLITLDPAANTTDVYAFVRNAAGQKVLVTALGVYPHQEPGIGPNNYNFDDNVLYEIHVATGDDVAEGKPTFSYQFEFKTQYKSKATILQSYLGVVNDVGDAAQNLVQTYTITKVDHRPRRPRGKGDKYDKYNDKYERRAPRTSLIGAGIVPPNNQGNATPFYNQGDNGENPAKDGRATFAEFDRYTQQGTFVYTNGYRAFAGQREDGFYGDIQSIFDLLKLRSPGKDSQGGFNMHLISLVIPVSELGGDQQVVGVYSTTSRRQIRLIRERGDATGGPWVQVGRQGNPLFCEALVAIADKDRYNRSSPAVDNALFRKYAETPELAKLINILVFNGNGPAIESNRTDIAGIFIPDLIKVDLSTGPVRVAGSGADHPVNPDDAGFSRLSVFGGDVLQSTIQDPFGNGGLIPGGWPNGRRFGDDVIDIAVSALISDLRGPLVIRVADGIDGVSKNDSGYNKVFPYGGTPHNGRNNTHP